MKSCRALKTIKRATSFVLTIVAISTKTFLEMLHKPTNQAKPGQHGNSRDGLFVEEYMRVMKGMNLEVGKSEKENQRFSSGYNEACLGLPA